MYVFAIQGTIRTIRGDNSKCIFFKNCALVSTQTFYLLSSTPQPSVGTRMWCSCFWPGACNKQFLLFSQCLLPYNYDNYFLFQMHFKISSAICLNLDQSKILLSANGLKNVKYIALSKTMPL